MRRSRGLPSLAAGRAARALVAALLFATVLVVLPQPAGAHRVWGYIDTSWSDSTIEEGGTGDFRMCRKSNTGTAHYDGSYWTSTRGIWDWEVRPWYGRGSNPATSADIHKDTRSGQVRSRYWKKHIWDWGKWEVEFCRDFQIKVADDNVVEPTETFMVVLTKYQHKNHHPDGAGSPDYHLVQIPNRPVGVLSVADARVVEGGDLTFEISMDDSVVPGGHWVTPTILLSSHFDSAEKSDFAGGSIELDPIWFDGTTHETHSLTISTVDDNLVENTERLELFVSSSNKNMKTGWAAANGRIVDNDEAEISFTETATTTSGAGVATVRLGDVTADEGYDAVYTVSLGSKPTESPFTVTVSPKLDTSTGAKAAKPNAAGTSFADVDYFNTATTFYFEGKANESHSGSVFVLANKDEPTVDGCTSGCTERNNETFKLGATVSGALGMTVNQPPQDATVTIRNSSVTDIVLTTIADDRREEGNPLQSGAKKKFVIPITKNHVIWDSANGNITIKAKVTGGTADASDYESTGGSPNFTCWDKYPSTYVDPDFDRTTDANLLETGVTGKNVAEGHHCALEGDKAFDAVFLEFEATPDSVREADETITFELETATYHSDTTAPAVLFPNNDPTVTLLNDDFERPELEFVGCDRPSLSDPCELDENGGSATVRATLRGGATAPAPMWLSLELSPDTSRQQSPASAGDARLGSRSLYIPKGAKSSNTATVTAVDNDVWTAGHKQMSVQARVRSTVPMGAGTVTGIGFNIIEDDVKGMLISPDTRPGATNGTGPVELREEGEGAWFDVRLKSEPPNTLTVIPSQDAPGNGISNQFTVSNLAGSTGATLTWIKDDDPDWWRVVRRLKVTPPAFTDDPDAYDSQGKVNLTARQVETDWWLKRTVPVGGQCVKGAADLTHSVTDLVANTSNTYKAYSAAGCVAGEIAEVSFDPVVRVLAVSDIAANSAVLTLTGRTGGWWLKQTNPGGGSCVEGDADYSHALTGLIADREYTYKAYSAAGCADGTKIAEVSFVPGVRVLAVSDIAASSAVLTLTGGTVTDRNWATAHINLVERDSSAALDVTGPDGWGYSLTAAEGKVDTNSNPVPVSYKLKLSGRPSVVTTDSRWVTVRAELDPNAASGTSLTLDSAKCNDSGDDARVTSKDLTFTQLNWNTDQIVNVYACEDSDTVSGSVRINHSVLAKSNGIDTNSAWTRLNDFRADGFDPLPSVDISVVDNDAALVTLELQDANGNEISAISENGGVATVVAKLDAAATADVTVRVGTQAQPNTTTSDYSVAGTTLTIAAGATVSTGTVTITGVDDKTDDLTKAVLVTATSSSTGAVTGPASVPLTLTDDDDAALTVTPATLTVDEGSAKTYTVQLASQPRGTVEVTPTVPTDHAADLTVSPPLLSFTSSNWDTPQSVTVTAALDEDAADNSGIELTHTVLPSAQTSYDGYTDLVGDEAADRRGPVMVDVTDTSASVSVSAASLTVAEGDASTRTYSHAAYSVLLGARPTEGVTVTVTALLPSIRDTDLRFAGSNGTGSCPSTAWATSVTRSFTASNWYKAQEIRVCAEDDADTAAGTAIITHRVVGTGFDNVTISSVTLTESDNDAVGLRFKPEGQDTLAAYGEAFVREGVAPALGARRITVTPTKAPTADVTATVEVTGDGFTVGATSSAAAAVTLTFAAGSTAAQSFWVHSADDADAAVNAGTVTLRLVSGDTGYAPTDPADALDPSFRVIQIDDDTAGIEVDTRSLGVREGGSASFKMRLTSKPSAEVRVYPVPTGDPDLRVNSGKVTFTPANWNSWRTVYVSALQDTDDTNGTATVGYVVASDDDHYHGLAVPDATVTLIEGDDETASTMFSAYDLDVPEGGSADYGVSLTQPPNAPVTVRIHPQTGADLDLTADTDTDETGDQHSLTFDSGNWTLPQTVTVTNRETTTGDDTVGTRVFVHTVSSSDPRYHASDHHPVTATELKPATENRILISPSSLRLTTDTGQYVSVRLARDPGQEVSVYLAPIGNESVIVQPPKLTFTDSNWNVPQVVTLRLNPSSPTGGGANSQSGAAQVQAASAASAQGAQAQAATGTTAVVRLRLSSSDSNIDGGQVPITDAAQPVTEPDVTSTASPGGGTGSAPGSGSGTGGGTARAATQTDRVAGDHRYQTAAALATAYAERRRSAAGGTAVDTVIVVSGEAFPDALAASMLSRGLNAPILLTPADRLVDAVSDFIGDRKIANVRIVGGTAAVSDEVEAQLVAIVGEDAVQRHFGTDRYGTAAAAAAAAGSAGRLCGTGRSTAIIASGTSFADAMIAGPLSYRGRHPVLLTGRDTLPEVTLTYLRDNSIEQVVVVGGEAVVGNAVREQITASGIRIEPVGGANRYETAAHLAEHLVEWGRSSSGASCFANAAVGLASGLDFADALAAAPLLGEMGAPLLLAGGGSTPPSETLGYVRSGSLVPVSGIAPIIAIGGTAVVHPAQLEALARNVRR